MTSDRIKCPPNACPTYPLTVCPQKIVARSLQCRSFGPKWPGGAGVHLKRLRRLRLSTFSAYRPTLFYKAFLKSVGKLFPPAVRDSQPFDDWSQIETVTQTNYPFEATADLPGVSFIAMRQMILMQVKSNGLTVLQDEEQHLTVETAHGLIGLRSGRETETAGFVGAVDEHWLFVMKGAVVSQMSHVMPEVAAKMRWSNGSEEGALPPNFAFVEVRDVRELGPNFYRVTFKGEDLSQHGDAAIHFRLVLPAEGSAPRWPSVAANGSVVWPDGPDAPHRPVYTTRSVDCDTNTLIMDVYIHEGGRVTEWARRQLNKPAARRVVGLLGPSGGGLLQADQVLMATDETGLPAAARLLENLPGDVTGDLLLESENGAACAYPIAAPPGIKMTWLSRASGESLRDATLARLPSHVASKIWFAGEREDARSIRDAAKAAGREAADLRISGFWRAPDAK
mgnify:CR=1 FL=1